MSFRYRRELDNHTKTKHGSSGVISMKERLDLLSDSSSDEDDSFDRETTSVRSSSSTKQQSKPPVTCNKCDSVFASVLHLKSHTCSSTDESIKCDTCFKTFKTNKAVQVHMKTAHKASPKGASGTKSTGNTCF